jgi:hypothetical protein
VTTQTVDLLLPDGTTRVVPRDAARLAIDLLWQADVRGGASLAAALTSELQAPPRAGRMVSVESHELAALESVLPAG